MQIEQKKNEPTVSGENSLETENPFSCMPVIKPLRATIPVQNGTRLSWNRWISDCSSVLQTGGRAIAASEHLFFGLPAGERGSVVERSIMARELRTACQHFLLLDHEQGDLNEQELLLLLAAL